MLSEIVGRGISAQVKICSCVVVSLWQLKCWIRWGHESRMRRSMYKTGVVRMKRWSGSGAGVCAADTSHNDQSPGATTPITRLIRQLTTLYRSQLFRHNYFKTAYFYLVLRTNDCMCVFCSWYFIKRKWWMTKSNSSPVWTGEVRSPEATSDGVVTGTCSSAGRATVADQPPVSR